MNTITSSSSNLNNSNPSLESSKYWCFGCEKEFMQNITTPSEVFCPDCGGISELIESNNDPRQFRVYDSQAENNRNQSTGSSQNQSANSPQLQPQSQPRSGFAIISEVREGPLGRIVVQTIVPQNSQQNQHGADQLLTANPFANFLNPMLSGFFMPGMGMDLDSRIIEEFLRNDPNRHGPPPAPADSINKLKETKFSEQTSCSKECTICQEDYQKDETVLHLPCEHNFHKPCVTEWLSRHNSCPVCRKPLDQSVDNNQA